jgi:hypothetical protein
VSEKNRILFKQLMLKDPGASRKVVQRLGSLNVEDDVEIDDDIQHLIRLVATHLSRQVESDRERWLQWVRQRSDEELVDHLALRTAERLLIAIRAGAYPDRRTVGPWIIAHAQVIVRQTLAAMAEASM